MIVIWRGLGILVPVVAIAAWLGCRAVINGVLGEGYYGSNDWPVYLTIGLVALALGGFGYLLNHTLRREVHDPETGTVGRAPSHTFFFVPVEYWAILVPAMIVLGQGISAREEARDREYLAAPIVGDVYVTDLTHMFDGIDERHKWSVMRVVSVTSDDVRLKVGTMGYGLPYGAFKAASEGEDLAPDYYVEEQIEVRRAELPGLRSAGVIDNVVRTAGRSSIAQAN